MPGIFGSFRLNPRSFRRGVFAALLALQGAVVLSPAWEPRPTGALGAHVEETGARHLDLHNEATCALCAVRSLHVVAPARSVVPTAHLLIRALVAFGMGTAPVRDALPAHLSRAPPPSVS